MIHENCSECKSLDKGIFCGLEQNQLTKLSKLKKSAVFKKGQALFNQGNPIDGIYCIQKGNVKLSQLGPTGKESILRLAGQGDILGHRGLFEKTNSETTAVALEDTLVCYIDKMTIVEILKKNPSVSCHLLTKIEHELKESNQRLVFSHQRSVSERFSEFLLMMNESHGEKNLEGNILLNLKLTREEMASVIGTTPETIIRTITHFKNEGIIGQKGKYLVIFDLPSLIEKAQLEY